MEPKSIEYRGQGIGTLGLLGVVFVTLKLTGTIDWSWWWVLLPFYIGWLVIGAILLVVGIIALGLKIHDDRRRRQIRKARDKEREQKAALRR